MKLCITTAGEGLDTAVDNRFGRAPYLVLVDTETMESHTVQNPGAGAGHGAGVQAAQAVARTGATALLTAHCGPKAFEVLKAAGIDVYAGASGTVREVLAAFEAGKLKKLEQADSDAGWAE
jgi:predicted Fe-Mo cluster-binding NifX family protein